MWRCVVLLCYVYWNSTSLTLAGWIWLCACVPVCVYVCVRRSTLHMGIKCESGIFTIKFHLYGRFYGFICLMLIPMNSRLGRSQKDMWTAAEVKSMHAYFKNRRREEFYWFRFHYMWMRLCVCVCWFPNVPLPNPVTLQFHKVGCWMKIFVKCQ